MSLRSRKQIEDPTFEQFRSGKKLRSRARKVDELLGKANLKEDIEESLTCGKRCVEQN